jgi:WD40 repeat protein
MRDTAPDPAEAGTQGGGPDHPPAPDPAANAGAKRVRVDFLAPAQAPDELGRLGPYRILKVLGAGGMGIVLLAEDEQLKRPVALKVMRPALAEDPEARRRFLREARAAASLQHDHIVTIHQVGEDRGIPFLAMEFLGGEALDVRLGREGKLPIAEVVRIGRQTATGLAAAHRRGLIHRDIKPANLWLEAETGRVRILDFGLARSGDDSSLTPVGDILGTPAYMAPEQAGPDSHRLDARCDLFSLGCVLYRMATGRVPFQGSDAMGVLLAVATQDPRPPGELNPELPPELCSLILRLLARDREQRPASAQVVVEALRAIEGVRTEPQSAYPSTLKLDRPEKPALARGRRSRRRILAAVGVALVAGAVGLGLFLANRNGEDTGRSKPGMPLDAAALAWVAPPDRLRAKDMPGTERFAWQPKELVAVYGEHRGHHWGRVVSLSFSRDGKQVISVGSDRVVRTWAVATGREVAATRLHFSPPLISWDHCRAAFSPDQKTLAISCDDDRVKLFDLATGKERSALDTGGLPGVSVFTSDSRTLFTASLQGPVKVWDVATGKQQAVIPNPCDSCGSMALSHDGKTLALGNYHAPGNGGERKDLIRMLNLETRKERTVPLKGNLFYLAFAPDDRTLACGAFLGPLSIVDVRAARVKFTLEGSSSPAFSPDGKVLAVLAFDGKSTIGVQLWDMTTGTRKRACAGGHLYAHLQSRDSLAFSPDGKTVASSGFRDGCVKLWDASTGKPLHTLQGHAAAVAGAAFTPDERAIVSWAIDNGVTVRGLATGKEIMTFQGGAEQMGQAAAYAPDAGQVVTNTSGPGGMHVWELPNGRKRALPLDVQGGIPLAVTRSGKVLALAARAANNPFQLHLVDLTTGKVQADLPGHSDVITALAFSPDGVVLASGARDRTIRVWDVNSGKVRTTLSGHADEVTSLAFSADGRKLVSGSLDGSVKMWDVAAGQPLVSYPGYPPRSQEANGGVAAVLFAADGETVFSAGYDGRIIHWLPALKKRTWQLPGAVHSLALSCDGRHLLTGNSNGTAYVLRLAPPPPPLDETWLRRVADLGPEEQVREVVRRLKEFNPFFDGKVRHRVENGAVSELQFVSDHVNNLTPLRALTSLKKLDCSGSVQFRGRLADLTPLRGLPLTDFRCTRTWVADLAPLRGMRLKSLNCSGTPVKDFTPLRGMLRTLQRVNGKPAAQFWQEVDAGRSPP